jgi:signal transduction histidine kinase
MQVQDEPSQEEIIQALQSQVNTLTAENQSLREQIAQKEQFVAIIAHELRGPLSPIINYAQILSRHICKPSPDEHTTPSAESAETLQQQQILPNGLRGPRKHDTSIQRSTSIIISQGRRLTRLVNDLLDSSRLASGQFSLLRKNCDIVALVKETVEQLRPVAPYHIFVCETPDAPLFGNWDMDRLQQAIGNLLDNAFKYSAEGTTITARVWSTSGFAHVSIHNQGASIPSTDIGLLFRPYTRLSASSARKGSGLGLYITKSIIEAHNGSLRLEPHTTENTNETAKGTTFTFDLPL